MTIEGDRLSLARAISRGTLIEHLGIEFLEAEPGRVVARMPVKGNVQPGGLLHGGATAALCETIASFGTALVVDPDRRAVGIELNINHLRGVREGHVTGTGVPLHVGRSTAVWSMEVRDDEGRLVAASRLTLAVRPATTE